MTRPHRAADAVREIQRRHGIVGREAELGLALAVLESGRHLLLEGPVGVGKTTVALAVCDHLGRSTVRVDGDDRYSEAKLTGWFDPPLVLSAGFGEESFTAGPLVEAMRSGSVLFINELNRMPETVQNVLLPALDERRIGVPHLGEVRARDGFQVVATQNPVEYVATGHLSEALRDRFEHLGLVYQSSAEEGAIVAAEAPGSDPLLVAAAVHLARATREDARIRKGASVRAAVATVEIATLLGAVGGDGRGVALTAGAAAAIDRAAFRRAAAAALRTRIELRDETAAAFDAVLGELSDAAIDAAENEQRAPPTDPEADATDEEVEIDPEPDVAKQPRPVVLVTSARRTLASLGRDGKAPDGWDLAARMTSGGLAGLSEDDHDRAEQLAVTEVMRRASALVGPMRGRTRVRRSPQREAHRGELDVATTLENAAGKPAPERDDWIVAEREEERRQVVLIVDTSGSMAGEPMALASVAAAVLALKVRPGDLGVVAFASDAHEVVPLGEEVEPGEVVRRLLDRRCAGSTNMEAALEAGERQLARSRDPRCVAVMLGDGEFTAGGDPRPVASRYRSLHMLRTKGAVRTDRIWITPTRQAAADVARLGGGRLVRVEAFEELPRRMLDLADGVLR